MDIRPTLRTGGSLALGVLALGAAPSGLAPVRIWNRRETTTR